MTEKEQKLIENLTKQLELSNKIALKQMQESNKPTLNEERLTNAEIGLMNEKESFYKNAANLLGVLSVIVSLGTILLGIGIISGLGACASIF